MPKSIPYVVGIIGLEHNPVALQCRNVYVIHRGYDEVSRRLGTSVAPDNAAQLIVQALGSGK